MGRVKGCTCVAPNVLPLVRWAGVDAYIPPLVFDWQDPEDTRVAAEGLVSKYLLQGMGDGGYRVPGLVLEFVKSKITAHAETVRKATALQALYLRRLDVVKSYADPEHGSGSQGLFSLGALWRSVEELSGDSELEVASYCASLGELESCKATAEVAGSFASVGFLFKLQVRQVFPNCPTLVLCG